MDMFVRKCFVTAQTHEYKHVRSHVPLITSRIAFLNAICSLRTCKALSYTVAATYLCTCELACLPSNRRITSFATPTCNSAVEVGKKNAQGCYSSYTDKHSRVKILFMETSVM